MSSERPRRISLHTLILIGLVLGAVFGCLANVFGPGLERWWSATFGYEAKIVEPLVTNVSQPAGKVFLNLLIMTVIPLVFASLAVGVARLGDLKQLGRIGAKTFAIFVVTMTIATVIGLFLVNTVQPGGDLSAETRDGLIKRYSPSGKPPEPAPFGVETFVNIVPRNPFQAAYEMNLLGIIFFALLVGVGLTLIDKERSRLITQILEGITDLMVVIINFAMMLAPVGVFALIFSVTALFGFDILAILGKYVAVVLVGLAVQMFGTLSLLVWFGARMNPLTFFRRCWKVITTAFSSSSSNATLPTTIRCGEEDLGVPSPIAGFVLPLGATMNMNGTALFEGVTVLFIAQAFGIQLDIGQQIIVVVLAVLTAIGAAGVPGGSIPLLVTVLVAVRVPPEGIGLVIGVDRLLDMSRTTLNVIGDLATAVVVTKSEGHALKV